MSTIPDSSVPLPPVPPPALSPPATRSERVRTTALVLLAVCGVTALLYFGRDVFIPLGLALVFTALLRPVVRVAERARVPTALAATLVVLLALSLIVGAGMLAAAPAQEWVKRAPESISTVRHKLRHLTRSVEPVAGALDGTPAPSSAAQRSRPATPGAPGVASRIFGATTSLAGGFVEVLLLAWFLLASGNLFPRKLLRLLPFPWEKKAAIDVLGEAEAVVSGYMFMTLVINICQGAAVGLAMWGLGMPTPVLWGLLTVLVEFVPYLGAAFMLMLLTVAGLTTFHGAWSWLLPPAAYLVITTLQNNLVSPLAYGRRLQLNPVAVLVSVMVWWTLWGVPGAFLAVPIVATAKVLGDRLEGFKAVGEFLGD
jgi:predicted PurR-regulated permease PerM